MRRPARTCSSLHRAMLRSIVDGGERLGPLRRKQHTGAYKAIRRPRLGRGWRGELLTGGCTSSRGKTP
jgi:hypothetical protein